MRRLLVLGCLLAAGTARADDYALVVGSNAGGPGQADLRYSEDDARRVGAVLVELGGYPADHVEIVVHPDPAELRDRLARLAERVTADAAAGRQSRVFFYYSGHAKASAIDLGKEELPLTELRQRLFAVPATLTVVVLDACQSGAFSRVMGAQPAADFSFNSRQHLDARGVAVMASSTGSELSQESDELHASYFTHHLLVGLRGAGDANGDGQVSIDEAYRYAYHQTLLATAQTAVGGQHVTLEEDLKGHGDVALSYPRSATTFVELPARLEGQALVEDRHAHAVIAETYKARGAPVRIAVAPGEYEVIVRHGSTLSRCAVTGGGVVDLDRCATEDIVVEKAKGPGVIPRVIPLHIEVAGMIGPERHDAFTDTLGAFRYGEGFGPAGTLQALALDELQPHLWVGALAAESVAPRWTRATDGLYPLEFDMSEYTLAAAGRLETLRDRRAHAWVQAAAGLGVGRTAFHDQNGMTTNQTFYGLAVSGGAGVNVTPRFAHGVGLGFAYQYDYAPVIDNLTGDTHGSGGHRVGLTLSYDFGVTR